MKTHLTREFLRIPYLGSLKNNDVLEYLLLKMTTRSALVSIPHWAASKAHIGKQGNFDLHLNNFFDDQNGPRESLKGIASVIYTGSSDVSQLYRIQFIKPVKAHFLLKGESGIPLEEMAKMLLGIIKDTLLIKNGVYIHLGHLIPFFSRLLTMSESSYDELKAKILDEIHLKVYFNIMKLEDIYETLKEHVNDGLTFWKNFEIVRLRMCVQSELDKRLIELAFNASLNDTKEGYTVRSFNIYIDAINTLEQRLYTNYNNVVILYSKALRALYHASLAAR